MQSFILVFSGILLLGSTGAFFLYVSILSIMAVVVILMALVLMFLLGVQAARQRIPVPDLPWGRKLRLVEALGHRRPPEAGLGPRGKSAQQLG
jgi:hypothetical protein